VPFTVTLNQGDVYQLQGEDLSGSMIYASNPVAVWGAVEMANVPATETGGDYLVEQLWPTSIWGSDFFTVPLATRTGGDTFRFLASQNDTTVNINGSPVATLNQGQFYEQILTTPSEITSNKGIYVMQYSNGVSYDHVSIADPAMMSIPPVSEYASSYQIPGPVTAIAYPKGFVENFENIVAPTTVVGNVYLDGTALPATIFNPIGSSGYSGASVSVAAGAHSVSAPAPLEVTAYGFEYADAYGYPGGLLLSAPNPSPTPTSTPANTPTLTPTSTQTPTPTPPIVDVFNIDRNVYHPSQGSVSITLGTHDSGGALTLDVYNTAGEHIINLLNTILVKSFPTTIIPWNGRNKFGDLCASGVYIFCLTEPFDRKLKKVVLVR
jgi:hypothetical protein